MLRDDNCVQALLLDYNVGYDVKIIRYAYKIACMKLGRHQQFSSFSSLFLSIPFGQIHSNVKKKYCQINALVDIAYAFIKCALHFHSKMTK